MAARRYFLAEIEGWNPSTSAVTTLYFTDGRGLATGSADTPADEWYVPGLLVPEEILYGRNLFADGRTGGASQIEISDGIAILNADGAWDHLQGWGWDGRSFRLYLIEEGQGRSDAILVLSAVMEQLLPVYQVAAGQAESKLVVRLKDPLSRFDVPIQPVKYAGTNVGPTGLEGTEDDLKGLPKPIAYGVAREVPARPVNTSLLIYQVADAAIAEVTAVYDNGVALALDADYATPALLAAASPASGEFATCLAAGLFMLGASPAGTITADIIATEAPPAGAQAVDFNGIAHYFFRSPVAGAPASKRGLFNAWVRIDGGDGTPRVLFWARSAALAETLSISVNVNNKIGAQWNMASYVLSTSTFAAGASWHHILLAWDFDASPRVRLYIDGVDETNYTHVAGDPVDIAFSARIGRIGTATRQWNGCIAEFWYGHGQWLDLSVAANREKFRSVAGYPEPLGATGAAPTGASPTSYQFGGPDDFGTNRGTGGDFTSGSTLPGVASSTPYAPAPSVPSLVTAPGIIRAIGEGRVGLTADGIDVATFDVAQLAAAEDVGCWIGDERSVRDVLDEIANSAAVAYWFRADGRLAVGRFALPGGVPIATWTFADLIELERQPVTDTGFGLPAYSIVVEHSRIYQLADGNGLAGSVDAARRAYLEREYRQAAAADNTVRAKHLLAPEFSFRTLITDPDDAAAFAADRLALYSKQRSRWRARVALDAATAAIDLFDVVAIQVPRFALDGGRLFRVIGIRSDFRSALIDFDLWGGAVALAGAEGFRGWFFSTGRVGGLRGAAFQGWNFANGRIGNITGPAIVGWSFPAGSVTVADLRITEAGDIRITEAGDAREIEGA